MATKGKKLTLLAAAAGVALVIVTAGFYWDDILVWYRLTRAFDRLPANEQGYPEYRHKKTGILFVKLPGGKVFVPSFEPPRVRIRFFLIAKHKVSRAHWRNVLGHYPVWVDQDLRGAMERVMLRSCEEFCTKADLSLPTEAQLEHAWDLGAIPEDASDLKPHTIFKRFPARTGLGSPVVMRPVGANFHPVYNLR